MYVALVAGVASIVGYALGVLIWWVVRKIWHRPSAPPVPRWGWFGLAVAAPIVILGSLYAGYRWQNQVRELVGEPKSPQGHFILIALVSVLVFVVVLFIARGIRWVTRAISSCSVG